MIGWLIFLNKIKNLYILGEYKGNVLYIMIMGGYGVRSISKGMVRYLML